MKELIYIGIGIGIGFMIANNDSKPTKEHPYIYWSDTINAPEKGFEQAVDMYYSTHRDTVYMELSYGPK